MFRLKITNSTRRTLASPLILGFLMLMASGICLAELEELEDSKLEELRAKEGITIDLSVKLSIGEIAFDFNDRKIDDNNRQKTLTPPPPRIEYHQNGN